MIEFSTVNGTREVTELVKNLSKGFGVNIQYLYIRKVKGGFTIVGKSMDASPVLKNLEKAIRREIDGSYHRKGSLKNSFAPLVNTVKIYSRTDNDDLIKSNLVRMKFTNIDCVANGSKWL